MRTEAPFSKGNMETGFEYIITLFQVLLHILTDIGHLSFDSFRIKKRDINWQ
jgi:hypothetical protein